MHYDVLTIRADHILLSSLALWVTVQYIFFKHEKNNIGDHFESSENIQDQNEL